MNIADKIIEANDDIVRKNGDDNAPDGYYTDDLGMWVELDIRQDKARFARYIFVRCRKLNEHLYYDPIELVLFNRHTEVMPTVNSILLLAKTPDMISVAQAIWVYNKLKETVPRLDRRKIKIAPGLAWDFDESEIIKIDDSYITVGGESDTRREI